MTEALAVAGTRRRVKELVDGTLRVEVDVEPSQKAAFLRLFPDIDAPIGMAPLVMTGGAGDTGAATVAPREVGLAERLHRDGYFRNPNLWTAMEATGIYPQDLHKAWLEQGLCMGPHVLAPGGCAGEVCAHHCNSAALPARGGKDNPRKVPHWYALALCVAHHTWAHSSTGASRADKERMLEAAVACTALRIRAAIKAAIGIDSLRELTPELLTAFEQRIGM